MNISTEGIRAAGVVPTPALLNAIAAYCELLLRWNRKINLTTITDPREILERNFCESFFGARWFQEESGTLCDVGSGAGFPGLALKLVKPAWTFRLYEPNQKKAAFLSEVSRQLNLNQVEVCRERWEDAILADSSVDVVTARAVGGYHGVIEKAQHVLKPSGKLILWIGAEEGDRLRSTPGWRWQVETLAGARMRILLIGVPQASGLHNERRCST